MTYSQSNELQIIPTKGLPIETTWSLIWLKGKNHSPVAAAFLDYLAKENEQIIQKNFE
jgi:DNA-binding transcriptional LysR family regulator